MTDDEAQALWRRAVELQLASERAETGVLQRAGGMSLEQAVRAAEGAGIDPDHLRVAYAENRLPDADELGQDRWTGRWLDRVLREPQTIEATRTLAVGPADALRALEAVTSSDAYRLSREDVVGEDPLRDAVLVYRALEAGASGGSFQTGLFLSDARVLLVTIRPHEGGSRIRIRAPLFRRGANLLLTGGSAGLFGGGSAGIAGSAATAMGAAGAVAAAPVAAGAVLGGALGVFAFRRVYRWARRKGVTSIDRLLRAVAAEAGNPGQAGPQRLPDG